jgi:hypothetical protein
MHVLIFYTNVSGTFIVIGRIQGHVTLYAHRSLYKVTVIFWSDFNGTWLGRDSSVSVATRYG